MVQTLRHLVFVHDSWFRRRVLGLTKPLTLRPPVDRFGGYGRRAAARRIFRLAASLSV